MMKAILDKTFKGWILEGIVLDAINCTARKIDLSYCESRYSSRLLSNIFKSLLSPIRISPGDLIVNQNTLENLVKWRHLREGELKKVRVFFSHPNKEIKIDSRLRWCLANVAEIIVMNHNDKNLLSKLGINEKRISVGYGGVDISKFFPQRFEEEIEDDYILISGDCKSRKRPDLILDVISRNTDVKFLITGRGWKSYLKQKGTYLKNLEIRDFISEENPRIIRNAKCLMSLSSVEGGPYPVLEALASGTPVLGSRTGWIPELVNESNGRLVELNEDLDQISRKLRDCIQLKDKIRHSNCLVGDFSWERYSEILFSRNRL